MRKLWVMGLAALVACSARSEPADDDASMADMTGDYSATLSAQNNSGVTGTASAHSAVAATHVEITIRGSTAGMFHPWHVHHGTCGSGGGIVGAAGAYPALQTNANGGASAAAQLGLALNDDARYHVNVHRSSSEMGVIIACGNLDN